MIYHLNLRQLLINDIISFQNDLKIISINNILWFSALHSHYFLKLFFQLSYFCLITLYIIIIKRGMFEAFNYLYDTIKQEIMD